MPFHEEVGSNSLPLESGLDLKTVLQNRHPKQNTPAALGMRLKETQQMALQRELAPRHRNERPVGKAMEEELRLLATSLQTRVSPFPSQAFRGLRPESPRALGQIPGCQDLGDKSL